MPISIITIIQDEAGQQEMQTPTLVAHGDLNSENPQQIGSVAGFVRESALLAGRQSRPDFAVLLVFRQRTQRTINFNTNTSGESAGGLGAIEDDDDEPHISNGRVFSNKLGYYTRRERSQQKYSTR